MTTYTRKQLENAVWKCTHRDFKGKLPDGTRTVLVYQSGGSALAALSDLTDAQLLDKLTTVAWAELHGYRHTKGEEFTLTVGQPVIAGRFPGVVTRVYDSGAVDVRLERGVTFVRAAFPDCYPSK